MARKYKEDLNGLPLAATHNWSQLKKIEDLLRLHAGPKALLRFTANDPRGAYNAETIDDLQAEAEKQDEPPKSISFQLYGDDQMILLLLPKGGKSSGYVQGADESFVHHVSTMIRAYLNPANPPPSALEPGPEPGPERPTYVAPLSQTPQPAPQPSFWAHTTVQIVAGVIGAVVAAIVVALIFGS
jgi:hypothetical protein